METGARRTRTDQQREESRLLQLVARGDAAALRTLYRAFERPLYTLGVRWLHDPRLAEELVQEVTLRVWRRAGSYDPERGAASSWIFGVARNVASDLARASSRAPVPVESPQAETESEDRWDEEGAWRSWEVALAVQRLPLEQQRIVHLAYVLQFTQSEIAKALGIPLGTVKTRLYDGLRKLRRSLEEMDLLEDSPR